MKARKLPPASSIPTARRLDDDGEPGDDGGDDDGGGDGLPSMPDVAFQIRGGFGDTSGCLAPAQAEEVRSTIEALLRRQLPGADVRAACVTTKAGVTATTIAVWRDASNPRISPARELGLRQVDIIRASEAVSAFVSTGFVHSRVQEQFDRMPRRYRGNGTAAADGPIRLTRFTLDFLPGTNDLEARVVLVVHGVDSRPAPDVDFTITFTDLLERTPEHAIVSHARTPDLQTDVGSLNVVTTLLLGLVTVALPPAVFLTQDVLSAVLQRPGGAAQLPGVGASIVREFFPGAVMIPGGKKLSMRYGRVTGNVRGLIGAGAFLPEARVPRCNIVGPSSVTGDFRDAVIEADYQVIPSELRGDLRVEWSGDDLVARAATSATTIAFQPRIHRKGTFKKTLRVKVTDADGLVATATRSVELRLEDQLFVPPNTGHTNEPL